MSQNDKPSVVVSWSSCKDCAVDFAFADVVPFGV